MKKILLIGSEGQLGSDISKVASDDKRYSLTGINHPEIDVTKSDSLKTIIEQQKPDAIISTAAYHEVDLCEQEPEKAYAVNAFGVLNLARLTKRHDIKFITFSTDYVFSDSSKKVPFSEDSKTQPESVYAASKLAGETLAKIYNPEAIVIRTCGLYGETPPKGKSYNFPLIMRKLANENKQIKVVDDQICTPTYTYPLAKLVIDLLDSNLKGVVHATSQGSCSWYDFAKEIFRICKMDAQLTPVSSEEYGQKATRPRYSVLENTKLQSAKMDNLPHWKDGLNDYLNLLEH